MRAREDGGLAALRLLLRATHLSGPDDLPALVTSAGEALGAQRAVLYLVDHDQVQLVPLVAAGVQGDVPRAVPVEGTLAGRAFSDTAQHVTTRGRAGRSGSPCSTARSGSGCCSSRSAPRRPTGSCCRSAPTWPPCWPSW